LGPAAELAAGVQGIPLRGRNGTVARRTGVASAVGPQAAQAFFQEEGFHQPTTEPEEVIDGLRFTQRLINNRRFAVTNSRFRSPWRKNSARRTSEMAAFASYRTWNLSYTSRQRGTQSFRLKRFHIARQAASILAGCPHSVIWI